MSIIEEIARTKRYYPKCKQLAKRDFMADELHQEFLLRLLEIGEPKVKEATEYIDWFCMDVINKVWSKRTRVKCYENGQTSPFYEFTNMTSEPTLQDFVSDYNVNYDYKINKAKKIIERDINSDDINLNFRSRVFTYSVGMTIEQGKVKEKGQFKNALQFAKASKINYMSVYNAFVNYGKYLKNKLK